MSGSTQNNSSSQTENWLTQLARNASNPPYKLVEFDGGTEIAQSSHIPAWLVKFDEFMKSKGQPNAESSSAASSGPTLQEQKMYVVHDEWEKAKRHYADEPELITERITSRGDTALHLAVVLNS